MEGDGHGLAGYTLLGRSLLGDARSIRCGLALERRLSQRARATLGADLIALARKPG